MFPDIQGGNQGTGNFTAVPEGLDKYESKHLHSNPAENAWQGPPVLLQREGNQGP